MRSKHKIFLTGATLLILLTGAIALPGARLFFQANHLRYLANANQFNQALIEYERLAASRPSVATRLPDFETSVTQRATRYYAETRLPETAIERQDYAELKGTLLERPSLAPLARRMDLLVTSRRDASSTPTLQAAQAILGQDGFDLDALWWAVISRHPTHEPIDIPSELAQWRAAVKEMHLDPQRSEPATVGRLSYLKGLLALADRNWADATYFLEQYRHLAPAELPHTPGQALAYGLALLRSGRSEAAIALLEPYTIQKNPDPLALNLLAEAFLSARSYPWAAQSINEIRSKGNREDENSVLKAVFGDLTGQSNPFAALCARLTEPGPYEGDAELWGWLASIADEEPQRQAIDQAALALARRSELTPRAGGLLMEYALDRPTDDLAQLVADGMRSPGLKGTFERIAQWYPRRNQPDAASLPLEVKPLGLLLTHTTTRRIEVDLPAGASAIVLRVKGYPSGDVWPILHLDLGELGRQTWYVTDRSRSGRPLVFVLRRPMESPKSMEAVISMLNGDPNGREDRNVVITDLIVF